MINKTHTSHTHDTHCIHETHITHTRCIITHIITQCTQDHNMCVLCMCIRYHTHHVCTYHTHDTQCVCTHHPHVYMKYASHMCTWHEIRITYVYVITSHMRTHMWCVFHVYMWVCDAYMCICDAYFMYTCAYVMRTWNTHHNMWCVHEIRITYVYVITHMYTWNTHHICVLSHTHTMERCGAGVETHFQEI